MIGIDVGFGWTKVAKDGVEVGKFPTWIAYYESGMESVEPVEFEGRAYVVGEDARYSRRRIELADAELLFRFFPVIVEYAKRRFQLNDDVVSGLAPKHYALYKESPKLKDRLSFLKAVLVQGVGVLLDIAEDVRDGEVVFVIDIGFNTIDYVLAKREGTTWRRYAIGSIEGLGVLRAIEIFKEKLPSSLSILQGFSQSRLIEAFEKGYATIESERVELKPYIDLACEEYVDILLSRLKSELSGRVEERDKLVLAGGGANLIEASLFGKDALIPNKPEYSNARGYSRFEP
ncbi:ParM/StbA family protein [Hydrogenobacter hydrogenophilus]|uniref:Uncharacterized protein n=1 Tax=Hydrogenobacter hydrogenophilus TaxID=35835 RepID=A0A285P1G4_9AQUI|nr:ParM/StbA family protein [Hydrogenobacter hydrogenophilus]SNZ15569.1 hypothetical protein SAMN06265353_1403 [Hydrogenobacter hydrogenophilus]